MEALPKSSLDHSNRLHTAAALLAVLALALPWLLLAGCRPVAATSSEPASSDAPQGAANEYWEALYFQNAKIGYGHTLIRPFERDGRQMVEVDISNHLEVSRFGQTSKQDFKCRSVETPEGEVLDFSSEVTLGSSPTTARGHVEGDELVVEVRSSGATQTRRLSWSSDIRGFQGVEQSLERNPMKPGETRRLKILVAILNEVAEVELSAKELETTSVLGTKTQLLRIEHVSRLPDGNVLKSTLWTDPQGRSIKTEVESLQQVAYRTTRAEHWPNRLANRRSTWASI